MDEKLKTLTKQERIRYYHDQNVKLGLQNGLLKIIEPPRCTIARNGAHVISMKVSRYESETGIKDEATATAYIRPDKIDGAYEKFLMSFKVGDKMSANYKERSCNLKPILNLYNTWDQRSNIK